MHILDIVTIGGSKLLQHAAELHNAVAVGLYDEAVDACQQWRRQETIRGVVAGICLVVGMGDSDAVTEFADPGRAARSTVPVQMLGLFQDANVGTFVGYQVANAPQGKDGIVKFVVPRRIEHYAEPFCLHRHACLFRKPRSYVHLLLFLVCKHGRNQPLFLCTTAIEQSTIPIKQPSIARILKPRQDQRNPPLLQKHSLLSLVTIGIDRRHNPPLVCFARRKGRQKQRILLAQRRYHVAMHVARSVADLGEGKARIVQRAGRFRRAIFVVRVGHGRGRRGFVVCGPGVDSVCFRRWPVLPAQELADINERLLPELVPTVSLLRARLSLLQKGSLRIRRRLASRSFFRCFSFDALDLHGRHPPIAARVVLRFAIALLSSSCLHLRTLLPELPISP
mmetsp:Transcript_29714/g.54530  ORF Transcript_29714/g.54530 Transcript_29714/m.54530 type:complete len:394 (-) Transcript_29714:1332-2513(-)